MMQQESDGDEMTNNEQNWLVDNRSLKNDSWSITVVNCGDKRYSETWSLARTLNNPEEVFVETPSYQVGWIKFVTDMRLERMPKSIEISKVGFTVDYFPNESGTFIRLIHGSHMRTKQIINHRTAGFGGNLYGPTDIQLLNDKSSLKMIWLKPSLLVTSREKLKREYEVVHLENELPSLLSDEATETNIDFWSNHLDTEFSEPKLLVKHIMEIIGWVDDKH